MTSMKREWVKLLLVVCLVLAASYFTYFSAVNYVQWGASISWRPTAGERSGHQLLAPTGQLSPSAQKRSPTNYDNVTHPKLAVAGYRISNIVHYVRFDQSELSFVGAVCILSAYINLKPSRIVIHTNTVPSSGKYWQVLKNRMGPVLQFNQIHKPAHIFGKPVSVVQHASDFVRIQTLLEHGGIYLDNDVFVVKSFDKYRNLSVCSIGWPMDVDKNGYIGNQIFVCPPGDTFMKLYLETYRTKFDDDKWYYNAGQVPSEDLLHMNFSTDLINAVPDSSFAVNTGHIGRIFKEGPAHVPSKMHWDWRTYTAIHLLYQHRWYMMKEEFAKYGKHDEDRVKMLDSAFGEMARLAYYGTEEMVGT